MNDRKKCPWCMEYACDHREEMWELRDNIRRLETENAALKPKTKTQCGCGDDEPCKSAQEQDAERRDICDFKHERSCAVFGLEEAEAREDIARQRGCHNLYKPKPLEWSDDLRGKVVIGIKNWNINLKLVVSAYRGDGIFADKQGLEHYIEDFTLYECKVSDEEIKRNLYCPEYCGYAQMLSDLGGCYCGELYPRACEKCGGEISDPCMAYEKDGLVVCSNCGNE